MGVTDHECIGMFSPTFQSFEKNIEGISPKVLSQTLKNLERDGFVKRTVIDSSPIRVEYALTPLGTDFSKTAYLLKEWAEQNIDRVLHAQNAYDANLKKYQPTKSLNNL
jgi:DNA-binding HxlR family transcriptional regulator